MGLLSRRMDKKIAAYQQELLATHYAEVDNMYRQIRGWRHDYRNHIQVMKAYAAQGDMAAISRYLDALDTDLNTVDTVIKTGNPMADAILNSKISLAKSRDIQVIADAHIPVKLKFSEIDLCCILGNLFDNAIEASQKLPKDEEHPALHLLHQFHQRRQADQDRPPVPQHQGRGPRPGAGAHRRHRRPAGRVSQPEFGERRVYHGDPAAAGVMEACICPLPMV